jgi:hypothetical protein
MSFFGWKEANINLASTANVTQPNRQLDMVFCIDATGSMQETIDAVRNRARELAVQINKELQSRNYAEFGAIRARVIFFRDFGPDQGNAEVYEQGTWDQTLFLSNQPPLRESERGDFYTLPDESGALHKFLDNETAYGGGDEPESGFLCLNAAIRSRWARPNERMANNSSEKIQAVVPLIAIWTDANVLPLDDEWSEKNPYYPRNAPRSLKDLQNLWNNEEIVPGQQYKTLVFFGNTGNASPMLPPRNNADPVARWTAIEGWSGYTYGGTLTDANKDLVNRLVDALETSRASLRLTE